MFEKMELIITKEINAKKSYIKEQVIGGNADFEDMLDIEINAIYNIFATVNDLKEVVKGKDAVIDDFIMTTAYKAALSR